MTRPRPESITVPAPVTGGPGAPEPPQPATRRSGWLRRLSLPTRAPRGSGRQVVSAALLTLGALLLVFVLDFSVIGSWQQSRDQRTSYAELRKDLANATTPVGQTDLNGRLLRLGTPIALLDIPAIRLREVVLEGTTSGVLMSGPGHLRTSVLPGQAGTAVIFGRQAGFGGPFARLRQLRPGDLLTVTTGQGVARYRVLGLRRAGDLLRVPATTVSRLTLLTADGTPYLPRGVLRVDSELLSQPQPQPPLVLGSAAATGSEAAWAGDPTAVTGLVLWSQALLVAAVLVVVGRWRWGRWPAWIVGIPTLLVIGLQVADQAAKLLPNLM